MFLVFLHLFFMYIGKHLSVFPLKVMCLYGLVECLKFTVTILSVCAGWDQRTLANICGWGKNPE